MRTELKAWGLAALVLGMLALIFLGGCSTQPMPNIYIGGADSCAPSELTLTIINGNDKAAIGGDINDDDSGLANPTLGL